MSGRRRLGDDEALAQLRDLLLPPEHPWPGSVSWPAFERANGVALPTSFRRFVDEYGTGTIEQGGWWIQIHDVVPPGTRFVDLTEWDRQLQRASRESSEAEAEAEAGADAVFPEPGGRLTWGYNDDGVLLGWRVTGAADDWIVCGDAPGTDFEGSFLEFVLAWTRDELPVAGGLARRADDGPAGTARFVPNRADTYAGPGEASASVCFAPDPDADIDFGDITTWDRLASAMAPAAVAECVAQGDETSLELTYYGSDEAEVHRHLRLLVAELGASVRSIRDGDQHDLWPDLVY
jgi:hypothetical protein